MNWWEFFSKLQQQQTHRKSYGLRFYEQDDVVWYRIYQEMERRSSEQVLVSDEWLVRGSQEFDCDVVVRDMLLMTGQVNLFERWTGPSWANYHKDLAVAERPVRATSHLVDGLIVDIETGQIIETDGVVLCL